MVGTPCLCRARIAPSPPRPAQSTTAVGCGGSPTDKTPTHLVQSYPTMGRFPGVWPLDRVIRAAWGAVQPPDTLVCPFGEREASAAPSSRRVRPGGGRHEPACLDRLLILTLPEWNGDAPAQRGCATYDPGRRDPLGGLPGRAAELNRLPVKFDLVRIWARSPCAYWRGFAKWRRVLNGFFDETPMPADLKEDLLAAISSFKAALVVGPDWIEAKVGIVGCSGSLIFLAGQDQAERDKILADYIPVVRDLMARGNENPRALWLIGGMQLQAPPPTGGDAGQGGFDDAKGSRGGASRGAGERRGASLRPPVGKCGEPDEPGLPLFEQQHPKPRAGHGLRRGGLVAAPDWRYVRDVLLPQIRALSEAGR